MSDRKGDLLQKTELRIEEIGLDGADLTAVAAAVADVLSLPHPEVLVIDARDDVLTLDLLSRGVDPYAIAGQQVPLFAALASLPGVTVADNTTVCAEGMLGWIAGDRDTALESLRLGDQMADEISRKIAGRAIVFSTGPEVISGQIRDTNKPWISARLREAGFTVAEGENLPDDTDTIAAALSSAGFDRGFGVVVTTGGVGAEGKDHTVEALLLLDNDAATPALFTVTAGSGRHQKGQVRIGVGEVGTALVVCLPGPHPEATLGATTLVDALSRTRDKREVAAAVAAALRDRFRYQHSGEHR
ncbi:molybdopterin-binding protein [Nocardia sp. NPDC050713]|uniref:molybdopterin-binding protein n=1 Tax=Nocardia sp. NPDC050713 TaxID=3154511 RepID=UPI0033D518B5